MCRSEKGDSRVLKEISLAENLMEYWKVGGAGIKLI